MNEWHAESFEIMSISIQESDRFLAVFAQKREDGTTGLTSERVDALAVAKVTTTYYEVANGVHPIYGTVVAEESNIAVVPMVLDEGWFRVCNQFAGYAGMCKIGDDIYDATGSYSDWAKNPITRPAGLP